MSDTQDVEALVARLESVADSLKRPGGKDSKVGKELRVAATALRTLARERDEQHGIVARIWELLGSPSYEDLAGRSIYDLIEELQADRARASSLEAQLAGAKEVLEDAAHTLSRSRSAGVDQVIEQLEAAAEALASAPASNKEPAPMTKQPVTVRAYVDEYEFRGDEACHTPTENERAMIEDAIEGYLFEIGASAPASAGVGDLDSRMKAAGMIPLSDLIAGNTPLERWAAHTGVSDLATFEGWLTRRQCEFGAMQAGYELGDKDKADELYAWVLSHFAAFNEVAANLRQMKERMALTPSPEGRDGKEVRS